MEQNVENYYSEGKENNHEIILQLEPRDNFQIKNGPPWLKVIITAYENKPLYQECNFP